MDFNKPDPSKSSSTSPPEASLEVVFLNSTHNKVTNLTISPPIFLDHVQIGGYLQTNISNRRANIGISTDPNNYFHNAKAWLNTDGKLRASKYHWSTNGTCLYRVHKGLPYEKPRRGHRIPGQHFNQLSTVEKDDIRQISVNESPWKWQCTCLATCLEKLGSAYSAELQQILNLKTKPVVRSQNFKIQSSEFYIEYEVGTDVHFIDQSLQTAINQVINRTHGNFVKSEDYGHGAKKWFINNAFGEPLKGTELKTYIKGRFLRVEIQFRQVPQVKDQFIESPLQTLIRLGGLATRILEDIHLNLNLKPQVIDEHLLQDAVYKILPRSKHDNRVYNMIRSFSEYLTYKPSAFGLDQVKKYQLRKLEKAGVIEPIVDHLPKDQQRRRGISYRLANQWIERN